MSHPIQILAVIFLLFVLAVGYVLPGHAQEEDTERGAYLATISGCQHCHSPVDGPAFSGGVVQWEDRVFYAPNLTPVQSGLAGWPDEALKQAITTGIGPNGRQLASVMPYLYYNGMADADVNPIIEFIEGLEPVEMDSQPANDLTGVSFPPPLTRATSVNRPEPAEQAAYGCYLVENVMACGQCHTPTLLPDGQPDPARLLAGGRAFSGEWGTVYSGNLTPSRVTGIGTFRDEEIILAIVAGQHPDRRPIYAMPWQAYSNIKAGDIEAVMVYLRSLPPIGNEIPLAELHEGYEYYPAVQAQPISPLGIGAAILGLLLAGGAVIYMTIQQTRRARYVRQTDWAAYFDDAFSRAAKPSSGTIEDNEPEEPPT